MKWKALGEIVGLRLVSVLSTRHPNKYQQIPACTQICVIVVVGTTLLSSGWHATSTEQVNDNNSFIGCHTST